MLFQKCTCDTSVNWNGLINGLDWAIPSSHLFPIRLVTLSLGLHSERRFIDTSRTRRPHLDPKLHISTATRTVGSLVKSAIDYTTKERW